jgi:hypothetical protein
MYVLPSYGLAAMFPSAGKVAGSIAFAGTAVGWTTAIAP